jgi:hypothetical protein
MLLTTNEFEARLYIIITLAPASCVQQSSNRNAQAQICAAILNAWTIVAAADAQDETPATADKNAILVQNSDAV